MTHPAISGPSLVRYGFLALPIAFSGFPLYVLAPDFYAVQHGLSLTTISIMLLILRMFDAIQDPFIGAFSDRFSHHLWFAVPSAAFILVAGIYALFHPATGWIAGWFSISMLVAVTAHSFLSINLASLGALWTGNSQDQTRISATREGFGLIGILLAVSLPQLLAKLVSATQVYTMFSLILLMIMLVALVFFRRWFHSNIKIYPRPSGFQNNILSVFRTLLPETKKMFVIYGLSVLASGIPAILIIFFVRDRLNALHYLGLFLLLYFMSGALAMPVWKYLAQRYGKYRAWLVSMLLAVAAFVWAFFLTAQDTIMYAIICVISGSALGADLALPPSILGDYVTKNQTESSIATQFSILALLSKIGLALASAISFPLLDMIGFIPAAVNTSAALLGLNMIYALIPCMIKFAAALLIYRFFIRTHAVT